MQSTLFGSVSVQPQSPAPWPPETATVPSPHVSNSRSMHFPEVLLCAGKHEG